ncbi:MAG TPA: hypothetical protein VF622_18965, partial [Segetibacter sp.]
MIEVQNIDSGSVSLPFGNNHVGGCLNQITYELWIQLSTKEWVCHNQEMNEMNAWYVAKAYGFSKKNFKKLVNHTSKKYTFLKKKSSDWWEIEINLVKSFPEKAA